MKKTLTILAVLLIAAFTVFAVEGNTITLNSTVSADIDYSFILAETSTGTYDAAAAGSASFEVTSDESVNFATNPSAITIAVSVTPWTGTTLGETNTLTLGTLTSSNTIVGASSSEYSVDFGAGYTDTFDIGTFSVSWPAKTTLAADSYTATVKIAYTQI